jgi:hypothetical protein
MYVYVWVSIYIYTYIILGGRSAVDKDIEHVCVSVCLCV